MTQQTAADLVGLSLNGYWKYERGRLFNPSIRQLANLAIIFGCRIEDLIEDDWREGVWSFSNPRPPDPTLFWRNADG
jgi:transcriptional regulator with XRE-family HTH domain